MLIFGCGYLGKRVAESLVFSGQRVWATTRDAAKAQQLSQAGIEPLISDWCDPTTLGNLPRVNRLLVAVSYDRSSGRSRRDSQVGGLTNLLQTLGRDTHICYISTTGVYHQTDGSWVDESSPAEPTREGGRIHLEAEQRLQTIHAEGRSTVLRLAGIYGPDRVPRAADVVAGRPIETQEDGFLNLIHVEDAARAVIQSWSHAGHRLYLVSDDEPVQRGEFYHEVARQTGSSEPMFVAPTGSTSRSARSSGSKRIRNDRMKSELIKTLRYPTYREGLRDVLGSTDLP